VCDEVLSLPLHPALGEDEVRDIAAAVSCGPYLLKER
jgi:dTDP-4-amino-4,6-dideoxygalactose transaminase